MQNDKIDELLKDIDEAGFGLAYALIPEDKKAALTKATSLGYLDIDPANNYCLSRIGAQIIASGLSYRDWEAQNSTGDGTGRLDDASESTETNANIAAAAPAEEEKPAKKSWLRIFGLK